MLGGLATAMRTLTILPFPGGEARKAASALPWFPLVGGALGGILYGICVLEDRFLGSAWPGGMAILVVALGAVLTRAIHLDGLADWADAFGSMSDRKRKLAIMKDPHVGAFGIVALVTILAAKWVAVVQLLEYEAAVWIVAAYVVSRAMQVELAAALPYARVEDGTAAPFVRDARLWHRLVAWLVAAALVLGVFGPAGAAALAVGVVIARSFGFWCRRRMGGVTGDLLGAASELVETGVLFLAALSGGWVNAFTDWGSLIG